MTKAFNLFTLLTIGLLIFSARASNPGEKTMNNDETMVLKTIEKMTSAFQERDINNVLASYEDGAAVMFEATKKISDRATIRQMFEGMFQLNPKITYPAGHEVYIANDIALHLAPWSLIGKAPDGTEIQKNGLSVAVLRKQENGEWLLVIDNPHGQLLTE